MRSLVSVLVVLLCFTALAQEQGPTLSMGEVRLTLGMPEAIAITKLTTSYQLMKTGDGAFFVGSKETPSAVVGTVSFSNGRLVAASRSWLSGQSPSGTEVANAIYGAIATLKSEGYSSCTLSTAEANRPEILAKTAIISCGKKSIRVDVLKPQAQAEQPQVDEWMGP